jgi:hypothetical protein
MSLLDEMKVACVLLEKRRTSDGEGGFKTTWVEGAKFMAAIVLNTSIEAQAAEKQGVTGVFTVTTDKAAMLDYHDIFRRQYDGKIFRVVSDGGEKVTPARATFRASVVTAEEYTLPDGGATA